MKVVFITNYVIFHQTGLWDSFVNNNPDVEFTYLATAHLDSERIKMGYQELKRDYILNSENLNEDEIQQLIVSADIVVYGMSEDPRVDKYMNQAKHIVSLAEHISKSNRFHSIFSRLKYFGHDKKFLAGGKKYLLAMSYHASDDFKHFGFKDRCYRFGYFPELEYKDEGPRDEFKLIAYGRLLNWKHPEHSVYALKHLKKKDSRYHLKIIGEGPYKPKLIKLVKRLKLQDSVEFSDYCSHDEILHELRTCGLSFFSSDRREGWGVALNEMLSQKAIVFANTNAGSTLFLANKKNAFIYNSKKLLMKKLDIYNNMTDEERHIIRERAYYTIKNTWNNELAASRMHELFVSIINEEDFDKYKNGPISKYQKIKKKHISDETDLEKIENKSSKNIALGTLFGWASFAVAILSGLFLIPSIISNMGEDYYGIFTLVSSLIALFLLDFGLTQTTNTYLAKLRAKGDKDGVERFTAIMFKLYLIIDVIFLFIIVILYFLVDIIYKGYTPEQRDLIKPILLIVGGYSLINFPSTVFTGVNSAYEKFGFNKFSELIQKIIYFLVTLLIVQMPSNVLSNADKLYGLVIINSVSGLIAILMRAFYMKFYLGISLRLSTKMDKETVKTIASFSTWALVLSICARLIFNITPSIIGIMYKQGPDSVTSFMGLVTIRGDAATQTTVFGIISTIEGYVFTIGAMMSGFFMAKLARTSEDKKNKTQHLQAIAEKVGKLQLVIIGVVVLGFITIGKEFINVWQSKDIIGDPNTGNGSAIYYGIIALIAYEIIHIPEIIFETAMYTENHIKPLAINSIVKASINCGLSFWLTSQYGAFGACLSICIARVIDLILNNFAYRKYLGISLARYFVKLYIRGGITIAVSLAASLGLKYCLSHYVDAFAGESGEKFLVIVVGAAFVIIYFICTFLITFNLEERYYYKYQLAKLLHLKNKQVVKKQPSEKLRVLQVVGSMVSGGLEAFIMTYYRKLYDKCEFTFVVFDDSTYIPKEEIERLGGHVIIVSHVKHYFKFAKQFRKILKDGEYDVVHSHLNTLSVFPLRLALKAGYPIRIAHSHATSSNKEFTRNLIKSCLKLFSKSYATHYFACSEEAGIYQFGKGAFKRGEVRIIKTAIDLNKFKYDNTARNDLRKSLGIDSSTIVVGSFGRVVETKNQKYILEMAKLTKGQDIKYLFVGSGPLEENLKTIIKDNDLSSVIMVPATPEIAKYYNALDILVLPSLYEGFGLAALEAEANGLYCVLSTNVPPVTLVTNYGVYLPIDNKSLQLWVDEIIVKHERQDFFELLTEQGYNIENSSDQLLDAYKIKGNI